MEVNKVLELQIAYAAAAAVPIIRAREAAAFSRVIQERNPKIVLELGTAIGYSAIFIASVAPDAEIYTIEISHDMAEKAREYFAMAEPEIRDRIHLLEGDAGEILADWSRDRLIDVAFLDAAKGQYPDYWRKLQPVLSDKAVVLADDVLYHGYVDGPYKDKVPRRQRTIAKRLREYIQLITEDPSYETEIYREGDGLAVSRKL